MGLKLRHHGIPGVIEPLPTSKKFEEVDNDQRFSFFYDPSKSLVREGRISKEPTKIPIGNFRAKVFDLAIRRHSNGENGRLIIVVEDGQKGLTGFRFYVKSDSWHRFQGRVKEGINSIVLAKENDPEILFSIGIYDDANVENAPSEWQ